MANRKDGYWILSLDPEAASHGLYGEIEIAAGDRLLAMTDGFTRLFDVFGLFTPESLMAASRTRELVELVETLRAREAEDTNCLSFPRIRCHDDASALLLEIITH